MDDYQKKMDVALATLFNVGGKQLVTVTCPECRNPHTFLPPHPGLVYGIRTVPCNGTAIVIYLPRETPKFRGIPAPQRRASPTIQQPDTSNEEVKP